MSFKTFTVPFMNYYSEIFINTLRSLGLVAMYPRTIDSKTNRLGTKNSASMICWPYRATLGSLIESVKCGVTDIITYSSESQCRFRHYGSLYSLALQNLGYNSVNVHIVRKGHILRDLKKITRASYFQIWKAFKASVKQVQDYECYQDKKYLKDINILLVGEIYTLLVPQLNLYIRDELLKLDMGSILPVNLSTFISHHVKHGSKEIRSWVADAYIDKHTGGHGYENVCHILANKSKVAGVIHILPMTCSPEVLVIPVIDYVCRKNRLPLLRLEIDDNTSPLNVITRLEAFVDAILSKVENKCFSDVI